MILRSLDDASVLYVTQTDHAALAAEILSLWRDDELPRRRELLFAVREHDNGWREVDSAPRRRPDGRPHDFLDLPAAERRDLWTRGARRWIDAEPWASRLILRHARELHRDRHGDPEWASTLAAWDDLEEDLATSSPDADEHELDSAYDWLALADELSLQICRGWNGGFRRKGREFRFGPDRISIDPFPLAGATSFLLRARRIADRPWPDETSLAVELATARWESRTVRLVPATGETPSPKSGVYSATD